MAPDPRHQPFSLKVGPFLLTLLFELVKSHYQIVFDHLISIMGVCLSFFLSSLSHPSLFHPANSFQFASKIAASQQNQQNQQNPSSQNQTMSGTYGGAPPTGYTGGPPSALQPGYVSQYSIGPSGDVMGKNKFKLLTRCD